MDLDNRNNIQTYMTTKQHIYIRQRSWANVMYSSPFVCLSVCLFVCLSVSRITQKVMDGFERNIMGR